MKAQFYSIATPSWYVVRGMLLDGISLPKHKNSRYCILRRRKENKETWTLVFKNFPYFFLTIMVTAWNSWHASHPLPMYKPRENAFPSIPPLDIIPYIQGHPAECRRNTMPYILMEQNNRQIFFMVFLPWLHNI